MKEINNYLIKSNGYTFDLDLIKHFLNEFFVHFQIRKNINMDLGALADGIPKKNQRLHKTFYVALKE